MILFYYFCCMPFKLNCMVLKYEPKRWQCHIAVRKGGHACTKYFNQCIYHLYSVGSCSDNVPGFPTISWGQERSYKATTKHKMEKSWQNNPASSVTPLPMTESKPLYPAFSSAWMENRLVISLSVRRLMFSNSDLEDHCGLVASPPSLYQSIKCRPHASVRGYPLKMGHIVTTLPLLLSLSLWSMNVGKLVRVDNLSDRLSRGTSVLSRLSCRVLARAVGHLHQNLNGYKNPTRVTLERGIITCICAPLELGASHGKKIQSVENVTFMFQFAMSSHAWRGAGMWRRQG